MDTDDRKPERSLYCTVKTVCLYLEPFRHGVTDGQKCDNNSGVMRRALKATERDCSGKRASNITSYDVWKLSHRQHACPHIRLHAVTCIVTQVPAQSRHVDCRSDHHTSQHSGSVSKPTTTSKQQHQQFRLGFAKVI